MQAVTMEQNVIEFENELYKALLDLKKNYYASALKIELGAEALSDVDAIVLKNLAKRAGLGFVVKTGGVEAVNDLYLAKKLGANAVVAPMIESVYAFRKFIRSAKNVFYNDDNSAFPPENDRRADNALGAEKGGGVEFFVNIETKNGFLALDEILNSNEAASLAGIVFGRSDMAASLGLLGDMVNSKEIFDCAKTACTKAFSHNKKFITGGGVSADSVPFFKDLQCKALTGFETRKIIFDKKLISSDCLEDGISKAVNFEILWLKSRCGASLERSKENMSRIEALKARCFS